MDVPVAGNGYQYEADEVADCLAAGRTQSEIMPLCATLTTLHIMDQLRASWGLKYPMD